MDKIVRPPRLRLLFTPMTGKRCSFFSLAPRPVDSRALAMGRERCPPDYAIARSGFPYHLLE